MINPLNALFIFHLLWRQGHKKDRDPKEMIEPNVIIVGGGPGGLLTAIMLADIGIKSTVIEKAPAMVYKKLCYDY